MKRSQRALLLLTGTIVLLCSFALDPSALGFVREPVSPFAKLEVGMTAEQVRQRVGTPKRIARQILYHRYLEQWVYDHPSPARLHFDCPRGEKPQLVWKQILPAEKVNHLPEANGP